MPKKSVQLSGVVVAQTELCSIDADRGILRYRGYDIADLAEHASYEEVAYLLLEGDLPDADDFAVFEEELAERELNASTFAARVVAGTGADLHSAIVAAICALKGPTHGGANEAAMRMIAGFGPLEQIPEGVRERLAARQTLFGFGHPVYTTTDPRARILKRLARELSQDAGEPNWYGRTDATERAVSEQKGLHANVDLYSGPLYRSLGIPEDLFTPLFECSRVAGQAAHVLEQHANNKIIRPAAEYVGPEPRGYPPAARPGRSPARPARPPGPR